MVEGDVEVRLGVWLLVGLALLDHGEGLLEGRGGRRGQSGPETAHAPEPETDERSPQRSAPSTSPLVGTPVPAVTTTWSTSSTWLTALPRTWRTPSAMPFMPWM